MKYRTALLSTLQKKAEEIMRSLRDIDCVIPFSLKAFWYWNIWYCQP